MVFEELDRNLDEVIIIDLLSEQERRDHGISSSISKYLAGEGVSQTQMNCSSKEHVFEALHLALARTKTSSFLIHFTAHGDEQGIGNNSGMKTIIWEDLRSRLAEINEAMTGGLIINMMACCGIHGLKIDHILSSSIPYYALVGPIKPLTFLKASSLSISFYSKLLKGIPIPTIVSKIIDETGEILLWAESSQARRGNKQ